MLGDYGTGGVVITTCPFSPLYGLSIWTSVWTSIWTSSPCMTYGPYGMHDLWSIWTSIWTSSPCMTRLACSDLPVRSRCCSGASIMSESCARAVPAGHAALTVARGMRFAAFSRCASCSAVAYPRGMAGLTAAQSAAFFTRVPADFPHNMTVVCAGVRESAIV